jgi:hypothetical protein
MIVFFPTQKYISSFLQSVIRKYVNRKVIKNKQIINHYKIFLLDGYDTTTDGTHIFVCYYDSQVC